MKQIKMNDIKMTDCPPPMISINVVRRYGESAVNKNFYSIRRVATRTQKRNCVHIEKSTKMKIIKLRTFT